MVLEYRKECGSSDVVQSLCEPQFNENIGVNGHSVSSQFLQGNGLLGAINQRPLSYTHLLQTKGESKNEEIVRARTTWREKKHSAKPFPSWVIITTFFQKHFRIITRIISQYMSRSINLKPIVFPPGEEYWNENRVQISVAWHCWDWSYMGASSKADIAQESWK